MTAGGPLDFADKLLRYCHATGGSVTSWGRTPAHNAAVGGVDTSRHREWTGADVVYDVRPADDVAEHFAGRVGLKLIRETDHDHLQEP